MADRPPPRLRRAAAALGDRCLYSSGLPVAVALLGFAVSLGLWRALERQDRSVIGRAVTSEARFFNRELVAGMEPRVLALVRMSSRWGPRFTVLPEEAEGVDDDRRAWESEAALYLSHLPGYDAILFLEPGGTVRWRYPSGDSPEETGALPPGLLPTLEAAHASRSVRFTEPLELTPEDRGLFAIVPVFHGDRFAGWMVGEFRHETIFDAVLAKLAPGYNVEIAHAGQAVYNRTGIEPTPEGPLVRSRILFYGSPMEIHVRPGAPMLAGMVSPLPAAVLQSGLLLASLLTLATHFAQKARRRTRALSIEHAALQQTQAALRESEEVFRRMFESASVGIARTTPEGRFLLTNEGFQRITGYSMDELSRLTAEELTHPDDWPRNRELLEQLVGRQIPSFQIEKRYQQKSGGEVWVHNSVSAVFDPTDHLVYFQAVAQDITERKRMEEALRASEGRYRLLADHAGDLITLQTPQGEIGYASPASESMVGWTPEDLVGRNGSAFIHPEDLERVEASRRSVLTGGAETSIVEFRLMKRSGGHIWAESTTRVVRDPQTGRVTSLISVTRDITSAVLANKRLRLLQELTATAHEAATPTRAIQIALDRVCEHTGWPVGRAHLADKNTLGHPTPIDIWHVTEPGRFGRFRQTVEKALRHAGEGLPARVVATGAVEWIEDAAGDPRFAGDGAADDLAIRAAIGAPARSGDQTLAVMEFFAPEPVPRDEQMIAVLEDIGVQLGQMIQRQRMEAALSASELRFRALAESAHDAIVIADAKGSIVYCNEGVSEIFGYGGEEIGGKPLTVLIPDRFHGPYTEALSRFLETREPAIMGRAIELLGRRKDGSEVPLELVLSWWESDEGVFFAGILRDISARKRLEADLGARMEELARSNAELGLFTYIASHDLREPLRTVASNVQLIERRLGDTLDFAVRKEIGFAVGGVKRMQALIEDLLEYSRVGTDGKPFGPVDSSDALEEAMGSLRVAIEESGGEVVRGPLPTVFGDRNQLVQLFQNLLSNALKFRGPEPPRVHVSAEPADDAWILSVRDNGIGIDPIYSDHIFTVFQRLHSSEEYPGTGIGLAVCRKIVDRHQGRIWVESEPGGGSNFRFTIPVPPSREEDELWLSLPL